MAEQDEFKSPFEEFPPEIRESVDGLIYLGHLDTQFEFCGHRFVIRTLKTGEELIAAQIAKEYIDTIGANRAFMAAQVGLALVSVDFDENFCPAIGPDPKAFARARFNYITQNWYTPTIEFIFAKYAELLQKQVMAIDAIGNLSEGNRAISTPSLDSLKDKGTSTEKTNGVDPT